MISLFVYWILRTSPRNGQRLACHLVAALADVSWLLVAVLLWLRLLSLT